MRCDVLVAGGGSAGIAAAVSAARAGARVALIERSGCLGGMASAALVHSICGLYLLGKESPEFANPGFASEFAQRLTSAGGAQGPVRMGRVEVLLQHPTAFAALADEMVLEQAKVELRLHTELLAADVGCREFEIECRGRREKIEAVAVVDATGDALVAALSGAACEIEESARLQRPAYIFALGNVASESLSDEMRMRVAHAIVTAVRMGRLPEAALGAALRASPRKGEAFVTIDLDPPLFDPLDPACLTLLEIQGRRLAVALADFLRCEIEPFAESYIAAFPGRAGIRESRRVVGRARLETADFLAGTHFPDAVAIASWPMELRENARGPRLRFPENNVAGCDIPLGALRSRDRENLFVAGRCISVSHEVQASIRVMGTCFATGETAGFAAACHADGRECSATTVNALRAKF